MDGNHIAFREKRLAIRYPVVLSVEFEDGAEGWTRDVSTTGAYIEIDQQFICGASAKFILSRPGGMNDITRVQCNGLIVRAEQVGKIWCVAFAMEAIYFAA